MAGGKGKSGQRGDTLLCVRVVVVVQGSFGRAGAGLAALSALALCTLGLLGFFTSKCVPFRCSRPQMPSPAPSPVCAVAFLRPHSAPPPPCLPCMCLDSESVRSRPGALCKVRLRCTLAVGARR